jgi:hypothetical protein
LIDLKVVDGGGEGGFGGVEGRGAGGELGLGGGEGVFGVVELGDEAVAGGFVGMREYREI